MAICLNLLRDFKTALSWVCEAL